MSAPAAVLARRAAALEQIFCIEFLQHAAKSLAQQACFQRATRCVDNKDVLAFLDARRGKQNLPEHAQRDRRKRAEPRRNAHGDGARDDNDRRDDEQRVAKEIVDRQPERRNHQHQRGELEPRLVRSLLRDLAIGGICVGQCAAPGFAGPYPLASALSTRLRNE